MADLPELSLAPVAQSGGTKVKPLKGDERYLQRHPKTGVWYYRHPFPERLRPYIPKNLRELKVSLGSKSLLGLGVAEKFWEASRRYEALCIRAEKLGTGTFDDLGSPEIARLVEAYRSRELADDAARRLDPAAKARGELVSITMDRAGYEIAPPRPSARWSQGIKIATEVALEIYRGYSADGDLEGIVHAWEDEAITLAASYGWVVDPASAAFQELCVKLNETAIAVHEDELGRMDGKIIPTPPMPDAPVRSPAAAVSPSGQSFREIVEGMLANPRYTVGVPTRAQVSTALRYLGDVLGDPRPEELTRAEVSRWLDVIAMRPAFVSARERVMPLGELVALYEGKDVARASQGTLQKHCRVLSKRWSHAVKEGLIPENVSNPFAGRSFDLPGDDERKATGFSPEELRGIFSLPFFVGGPQPRWRRGEAAYWLPLMALYTGARPEEIAQLVLSDIYDDPDTGRSVLSFVGMSDHPEKGRQRLKTREKGTGQRIYPVPPGLISLGFLDYVGWLRSQGEEALFPRLRVRNKFNRLYPSFGDNWREALYENGILQRRAGRQPFREFRHTFVTGARESRIPEEAIAYLIGHTAMGDNQPRMTRKYGKLAPHAAWIDDYRPLIDVLELVKPWRAP